MLTKSAVNYKSYTRNKKYGTLVNSTPKQVSCISKYKLNKATTKVSLLMKFKQVIKKPRVYSRMYIYQNSQLSYTTPKSR